MNKILALTRAQENMAEALAIAMRYGGIDGAHHKDWVIDQMVRALTGCARVEVRDKDINGKDYLFLKYNESETYLKFVAAAKQGVDNPETYEWNVGIAP
jgi:hypothetical protein